MKQSLQVATATSINDLCCLHQLAAESERGAAMAAMKKADRKSHGPFLLHRTPAAEGDKAAAPPPENASVSAVRVAQTEKFVDAIQV